MNNNKNLTALIDKAIAGDRDFLETVILGARDQIFNLSMRMLGTFHDVEDAIQDIIRKVITNLSPFKQESSIAAWVFRIVGDILGITLEQIKRFLTEFLESTTLSTTKTLRRN